MASASFLLKEPSATKATPVFAFVSFDGQRVKVSTGLSILPKQWLKGEQRAQVRGLPDNGMLNDALVLAEEQLLDCYQVHRSQGQLPSTEALRAAVVPVAAPAGSTAPVVPAFEDYFDEWIALACAQQKPRSAQVYATAARHVREFAQATGYAVAFDTITPTFGDRYTTYLLHKVRLTDNTVAKQVHTLKRFLR